MHGKGEHEFNVFQFHCRKCQCRMGSAWQVSHKGSKAGTDVPQTTPVVKSRGASDKHGLCVSCTLNVIRIQEYDCWAVRRSKA